MDNLKTFIDLWNWYIKALVFMKEEEKTNILAKEIIKTKWLRKGKILDAEDLIYCISKIFEGIRKKLGDDVITKTYVWVSHPEAKIVRVSENKRILNNWKISQDDVDHILKVLDESAKESNYEILKIVPVYWMIDEDLRVKDPIWMEWQKLKLTADVFMIPKSFLNWIQEIFSKIEQPIEDIVPNILSLPEAVLDVDSKDLWTLVLDIWANQTSYIVYEEWYAQTYGIIPIGWENVTKDISIVMQVDIKEAETLKKEKAQVLLEPTEDSWLDINFLSEIVSSRYEELFNKINERLVSLGLDTMLPGWVVLVWGGAEVRWLDKLAKQVFKLAAFYWKDKTLHIEWVSNDISLLNIIWNYIWNQKFGEEKRWFSLNFWWFWSLWKYREQIVKFLKNLF